MIKKYHVTHASCCAIYIALQQYPREIGRSTTQRFLCYWRVRISPRERCMPRKYIKQSPLRTTSTLRWRHNDHAGVPNHQPHGCLLNRLFRRRSKKTSKLRVTGLCAGNSPGPVNSPHKGPVTRKMFPFDDVIMNNSVVESADPGSLYN